MAAAMMDKVGRGGYAEVVDTLPNVAHKIPDDMPFEDAAAFNITYQTGWFGLHRRAQLQPGEVLLVHGGAGGTGTAAIQLGKAAGATVIATAGSDEKVELCLEVGADHAINYKTQDFADEVNKITDRAGADVIWDPVGGDVYDRSTKCIAFEGRIVIVGFTSGRIPEAKANHVLVKNYSVVGLHWGAYQLRKPEADPGRGRPALQALPGRQGQADHLSDLPARGGAGRAQGGRLGQDHGQGAAEAGLIMRRRAERWAASLAAVALVSPGHRGGRGPGGGAARPRRRRARPGGQLVRQQPGLQRPGLPVPPRRQLHDGDGCPGGHPRAVRPLHPPCGPAGERRAGRGQDADEPLGGRPHEAAGLPQPPRGRGPSGDPLGHRLRPMEPVRRRPVRATPSPAAPSAPPTRRRPMPSPAAATSTPTPSRS